MSANDIDLIAYSPSEASNLALRMVDSLRKDAGGGIRTGIVDLDKVLLPLRPGELVTVLGYTSHYKSGFMNWLSKQALKQIADEERSVVVRVTWEQSVEEDTLTWLAGDTSLSATRLARGMVDEAEWKILELSAIRRATTPMWIVGHSQQENAERRRARPRMTMSDVARAIEYIANDALEWPQQIKLVVLDYLQRIRPDASDGDTKREQMMEAVNRAKDCAIAFGCPVILGVQVGRQIMNREFKFPDIDDGQETSNIEQSSDKMISLWYPIKTEKEGEVILGHTVNKNLLFVRLLKQKFGEAPCTFAVYLDPERNNLWSLTKEAQNV